MNKSSLNYYWMITKPYSLFKKKKVKIRIKNYVHLFFFNFVLGYSQSTML